MKIQFTNELFEWSEWSWKSLKETMVKLRVELGINLMQHVLEDRNER